VSTGKDSKTMPITAEYADGYERTFGTPTRERGTFIYDKRLGKCVPIEEYTPDEPDLARNAPIMVDRFMEGASTQDGVDIGSRRKRKDYMRATGSADASDTSPAYFAKIRAEKEAAVTRKTHETVAEIARTDTRHLRKAVDEMRRKR
jgi:hypothetical protein